MGEINLHELNRMATEDPCGLIAEAESNYRKRVDEIAKYVVDDPEVRIILLAGPSGSGKTTTANLIADAVRLRGEESLVVSLDDFYRDLNDPDYPRIACGERDFECPEALRLDELSLMLSDMATGKSFYLPKYDFKAGGRVDLKLHGPMPDGCLIIEGLHALNPRVSDKLVRSQVMKLFVSVSTNVNDGGRRILSGRKLRFVRRMVRDSIYRATDVRRTLELWQGVLAAEDVHLYPYKPCADMAFDTFHPFEIGVMRRFALPHLTEELASSDEYVAAVRGALLSASEIDDALVPDSSLIREFIPGGIYEELY